MYHKSKLDNGVTVISEHIPHVRSVSIGVWLRTGTRFEIPENNGVAHFLEHMMFKATRKRSAREIVRRIESLGGNLNAFTSKEQTCFHIEIMDDHLPKAIDLLADVLCRDNFSEKEFEKERYVILDEIQAAEDTPEEVVHEAFASQLFGDHSLGYPILGTAESIESMTLDTLWHFYTRNYVSDHVIIAVAGNLNHQKLVDIVQRKFTFAQNGAPPVLAKPRSYGTGEVFLERAINQAHICVGVPGVSFSHPGKFNLMILNAILGGGMGSRLFQNIRERHGIAYGIYSTIDFYHDSGVLVVYLGTDVRNVTRARKMLANELNRLMEKPVSVRELADAKSYLKGNMMLSLESSISRMNRLAMLELYDGQFYDIDRVVEQIDRVNRDSLQTLAQELLQAERRLEIVLVPKQED